MVAEPIADVFDKMPAVMFDINDDGVVNCIDYSLCFKVTWDSLFFNRDCEIVYNSLLNHLFIRARIDINHDWIYIEPQGTKYRYTMQEIWGDRYIVGGNVYGGTVQWLNELRR